MAAKKTINKKKLRPGMFIQPGSQEGTDRLMEALDSLGYKTIGGDSLIGSGGEFTHEDDVCFQLIGNKGGLFVFRQVAENVVATTGQPPVKLDTLTIRENEKANESDSPFPRLCFLLAEDPDNPLNINEGFRVIGGEDNLYQVNERGMLLCNGVEDATALNDLLEHQWKIIRTTDLTKHERKMLAVAGEVGMQYISKDFTLMQSVRLFAEKPVLHATGRYYSSGDDNGGQSGDMVFDGHKYFACVKPGEAFLVERLAAYKSEMLDMSDIDE
jgi:hypothetical protein